MSKNAKDQNDDSYSGEEINYEDYYLDDEDDYLDEDEYQDQGELREFAREVYEEHVENEADLYGFDLPEAQQELAGRIGVEKKEDVVDILMRFYYCTKREPRFVSTYTENDGSTHSGTGSLFDR